MAGADLGTMLEAALHAAREAGKIQLSSCGQRVEEFEKDRGASFATEVDYRCEQAILDVLRERFPDHGFIAEESGSSGVEHAEHTWAIDPLDGTISYVSGQPYFAVSIGLLRASEPVLGVIHLPALGKTYWASRGGGAYRDGDRIHVSGEAQLHRAVLGFDLPDIGARTAEVRRLMLLMVDVVRFAYVFGGAAANLAFVAEGTLDGYVHDASIWDFAAGAVLVAEAGDRVSDPDGQRLHWTERKLSLAATNGTLHDAVLERLRHG